MEPLQWGLFGKQRGSFSPFRMGRLIPFANIPLRLVMPEVRENIEQLVFKTIPSVNKVEIRRILWSLYGLKVESVDTINYEGKKKRHKYGFYRRADYKKAYVTLKEPITLPEGLLPTRGTSDPQENASTSKA